MFAIRRESDWIHNMDVPDILSFVFCFGCVFLLWFCAVGRHRLVRTNSNRPQETDQRTKSGQFWFNFIVLYVFLVLVFPFLGFALLQAPGNFALEFVTLVGVGIYEIALSYFVYSRSKLRYEIAPNPQLRILMLFAKIHLWTCIVLAACLLALVLYVLIHSSMTDAPITV